jgi:hypothetical protein
VTIAQSRRETDVGFAADIDVGFSAEGDHETTDMHLMSFELTQQKLRAFARDATDYELVQPVLRIAANGYVEHL